ncbi:MAG: ABC transporter ATP-binding protein [Candidatus Zixiibacteriota bacterium]|nr:MAG: ABC transporter ATP-binding protein [candidate division Zixibacteria bacterium]
MSNEFYIDEEMTPIEQSLNSKEAFTKLLPLLKKHKLSFSFCLLLLAGATILSLYWPILLKKAIDVNIKNSDFNGLLFTVLTIGLIQTITLLLQYIQTIRLETIGQDVMVELKQKLFNHVLSLNVSFFDKNPIGRLMARIESDTESLRMLFTNTVVMIVGDLILIMGIFGVMFYHSWRLTLILTMIIPIIAGLIFIFQKKTTIRFLEVRKKMAEITATLTEFLHGISIIQIFHRDDYVKKKFNHVNKLKFKDDVYVNIAVVFFYNSVFSFEYIMIGLVLYFGVLWIESGVLTVGTISMFIILIWRSFEPIHRASEQLSNIQKAIAGAKRIFALLSNNEKLPEPIKPVSWNKLDKGIRFENVWFSYSGDKDYVLKNITFEIPRGKRVALAGVTGGGKSTIISLLLRFYDPQRGRITVDGIDIKDIPIVQLRSRFALVLQDIFLFPGDIKSNIALESNEITNERIAKAALVVDADRFIQKLPEKYNNKVSEKGTNFSRGERQLLSFARALVVDPDVLILDEATSSVDPQTERTIHISLKKLMVGRTSLIIAHRLLTILDADQILVVRNGDIIERGTHNELILKDGYYSKLFHLQFKNGAIANVEKN